MASLRNPTQQSDPLETVAHLLFASRYPLLDWTIPSIEKQRCYKDAYIAILASTKEAMR